ncbi:3-phosphoshikimate 1-carboxyvinyltransferase [Treponema bryantii]|uniref:3-phosphoshikimate 1-carboxyvinyltransferase n=1 Tax=Treponema bryantii TaxID=163 RepID=A0A1I3LCH4_9SPIR|nr:3-phosphoshikimate 1-carboxyvinyltransferase [Treponema bryantii]SFI82502.1 3-phosphoshikimate 1-carboxyvinyltransferase [Treponema bryantii]
MKAVAKKSVLSGHITVPGSKSHTIRALILAAMADGTSHISNPLPSNDCLSTAAAVRQVGAEVDFGDDVDGGASTGRDGAVWTVRGAGKNLHLPEGQIDVGNSGSLMYFLCPVLSTLPGECTFTGDESICRRPVNHLIDALCQFGANGRSLNAGPDGKPGTTPPFSFCGPIDVNKTLVTEGALSQYISGFMMAASRLNGTLHMELTNPKETPYLTMTKLWLESVGVPVSISPDFKKIAVTGPVPFKAFDRAVPSDWEGVAFPLVAALISGSEITIDNVDGSGSQGDDKIVEVLQSVGADIEWRRDAEQLIVRGGKKLSSAGLPNGELVVEMSAFPDAICALAVAACFIEGKTVFTDIDICRKKETDRIKAMTSELSKLGAKIVDEGDRLVVYGNGGEGLHGGEVESYKDHRIVMSLACLGLGLADGEKVTVNDAEWCSVTFPHFFEVMNKIGAGFETI